MGFTLMAKGPKLEKSPFQEAPTLPLPFLTLGALKGFTFLAKGPRFE
jgi:hypothetical protein